MVLRINSGLSSNKKQKDPLEHQPKNEAGSFERNIVGPITRFAGTIPDYLQSGINIIGLPSQRAGMPEITALHGEIPGQTQGLRESYAHARGITPESLEPKSPIANGVDYIVSEVLPIAASGGFRSIKSAIHAGKALLGARAGGYALGKTAEKGAQILGAGEDIQKDAYTAGHFLGSVGGGIVAPHIGIQRPSKNLFINNKTKQIKTAKKDYQDLGKTIGQLENSRTNNYAQAKSLAKKMDRPAPQVQQVINEIEEATSNGVSSAHKKQIFEQLNDVQGQFKFGKLNVGRIIDTKQNINSSINDRNLAEVVRKYYSQLNRGLNNFIKEAEHEIPQFGNTYRTAEEQTKTLADLKKFYENIDIEKQVRDIQKQTYPQFIEQLLENDTSAFAEAARQSGPGIVQNTGIAMLGAAISQFIPYGKTIAGLGYLYKGGKAGVGEVYKVKKIMDANPQLYKDMKKAVEAAVKKDYPLFASRIIKAQDALEAKAEKSKPKATQVKSKLRLGI